MAPRLQAEGASFEQRIVHAYPHSGARSSRQSATAAWLRLRHLRTDTGAPDDQGQVALRLFESFNQSDPDDPAWHWPGHLVPIAHWGCAIQSCIDVSTSERSHGEARSDATDPMSDGRDVVGGPPLSVEWWTAGWTSAAVERGVG